MSPVPMVRGQAVVVAVLLVGIAALGASWEAGAIAVGIGLAGMSLRWKYRHDLARTPSELPPHRDRLDLIVSGDLRVVSLAGLAVAVALILGQVDGPDGVNTARSVSLALLTVATSTYTSSLVDWFLILPRISGQLGARPCRAGSGQEPGIWPATWSETTRWWYLHRILAALVFRFGLGYAVTLGLSGVISLDVGTRLVSVGLLGIFAEYSPLRLAPLAREAMHTQLSVGRTVRRVQRERRVRFELRVGQVSVFTLHRKTPRARQVSDREYVYDVSVEGVKLVSAASREGESAAGGFEKEASRIGLRDIDEVEAGDPPFSGCEGRCSGINWYCIENPRCFEAK